MTYKQETIVEELHKGVCTVVFTKTDGTDRTMKCTLNPTYAPSMPEFINEDKFRIGKFGKRWRLRPISFNYENSIILNKG